MNKLALAVVLTIAVTSAGSPAWSAVKSCEELKNEIEARVTSKKVASYSIEVVPAAEAKEEKGQRIVGTCEGGKKKIIYKKGGST